jgi:hypothetical protein
VWVQQSTSALRIDRRALCIAGRASQIERGLSFDRRELSVECGTSSVEPHACRASYASSGENQSNVECGAASVKRRASSVERRPSGVDHRALSVARRASSV